MKFYIVRFKPFETSNIVYRRFFLFSNSAFRFAETKPINLVIVSECETSSVIRFLKVVLFACLCISDSYKLILFSHGNLSN